MTNAGGVTNQALLCDPGHSTIVPESTLYSSLPRAQISAQQQHHSNTTTLTNRVCELQLALNHREGEGH